MKGLTFSLLAISGAVLLTACTPPIENLCGYQMNYGDPYHHNSKCGPRIQYHCDHVCNTCRGNESSCKVCWTCLNQGNE